MTRSSFRKRPRRSAAFRPLADALEGRWLLSAAEFQLSSLLPANGGNGSTGSVIDGNVDQAHLGSGGGSPLSVGDVNGDGIPDFLVCAPGSYGGGAPPTLGYAYLVFGTKSGFPDQINLSTLNRTNGYCIDSDQVGEYLSYGSVIGDVNHDGIPDIALGAIWSTASPDRTDSGRTFVIFGGLANLQALDAADGTTDGVINLDSLDGVHGFTINGTAANQRAGVIKGLGDVNGDGVDDIGIMALDPPSNVYVVYGRDSTKGQTFPATLELSSLNGSNGFVIQGSSSVAPTSLAGGCDINGDGIDDLAIGCDGVTIQGHPGAGQGYVIFGSKNFPATFNLTSVNGTNGFTVNGVDTDDYLGYTASMLGDVNGDGVDDVCFSGLALHSLGGSTGTLMNDQGGACVVFGKNTAKSGPFPAAISIDSLNGTNGFTIVGMNTNDLVGEAYSVGDVNGDGYDDILLASQSADRNGVGVGEGYVVYGGPSFPSSINLGILMAANGGDGSAGRVFEAFQNSNNLFGAAGLGDINGDGYADMRFSSPFISVNGLTENGEAYIVYGQASPPRPAKFDVVDGSSDQNYAYTVTSIAAGNYALTSADTAPRGEAISAAGNQTWVVDANKNVYVYDRNGNLLGSWTAGSLVSNASVQGVASNGTDVWIVDAKADKVYRYTGAASRLSGSQAAASSFSLNSGNSNPTDIVTDGTYLWVLNASASDKVFKYTVSGSLLGSWTIKGAGSSPTGITIDPNQVGNIWIVDNGTKRVYQFDNAASLTSGQLYPSTSFALAAGNTNPQGIADPPSAAAPVSVPSSAPLTSASGPVPGCFVLGNSSSTLAALDQAIDILLPVSSTEPGVDTIFPDLLHIRRHRQG